MGRERLDKGGEEDKKLNDQHEKRQGSISREKVRCRGHAAPSRNESLSSVSRRDGEAEQKGGHTRMPWSACAITVKRGEGQERRACWARKEKKKATAEEAKKSKDQKRRRTKLSRP